MLLVEIKSFSVANLATVAKYVEARILSNNTSLAVSSPPQIRKFYNTHHYASTFNLDLGFKHQRSAWIRKHKRIDWFDGLTVYRYLSIGLKEFPEHLTDSFAEGACKSCDIPIADSISLGKLDAGPSCY